MSRYLYALEKPEEASIFALRILSECNLRTQNRGRKRKLHSLTHGKTKEIQRKEKLIFNPRNETLGKKRGKEG